MITFSRSLAIVLLLNAAVYASFAQTYSNVATNMNIVVNYQGGESSGGCSFVDWDDDGFDDLTICQNGTGIKQYKNVNGFLMPYTSLVQIPGEVKLITWVDFDNDGDKDLCATIRMGDTMLWRNDDGVYVNVSEEAGFLVNDAHTFGHSWGDYDRDGLLDLYVCNYDYFIPIPNECYHNNGDGTFTEVASLLGITDGANFSFQSVWLDYNDDGWQDLFVINDRLYSANHMYRNDGDGGFTDVSEEMNLDYVIFSMSNTVGDYDNDGDMDIYVTNNPTGHLLHRMNEEGTYDEVALEVGVATYDMGWSAQWIDYDLDGWQDLHVNCTPFWQEDGQNKFFVNNHDGTFTYDVSMGFDNDLAWSHSSCIGDYNNDGMFDIFVLNNAPNNSSFWRGYPGSNHYLKVSPKGIVSNKDGVGTKIQCHMGELTQTRYTYCGEAYLSQNSKWEIFGLDTNTVVDSLVVTWLSGHVDKYYNLEANQQLTLIEGSTLAVELPNDFPYFLCPGDSVEVLGPMGYASYLWSNGDTTSSTFISTPDFTSLTVTTVEGLSVTSDSVQLQFHEPFEIEWISHNVSCFGNADGMVQIFGSSDSLTVDWGEGIVGDSIASLSPGVYPFTVYDQWQCSISQQIEITEPDLLSMELIVQDATTYGLGTAEITITGGVAPYTINWSTDEDELSINNLDAGNYSVSVLDSNGCEIMEEFSILFLAVDELPTSELTIYPNPSHDKAINLSSNSPMVQLRVFNIDGKIILTQALNGVRSVSNFLAGFAAGSYVVEVTSQDGSVHRNTVQILGN
jgi:hypothetical protein